MSFATAIYAEMCSMFYERVNSHEATVNLDMAISALEDTRKKLSLKYHPDKSADEDADEKFKCIAPAKKQLEKTIKRDYNEEKLQEKLQIKREKEEAKRRQNETQARRRNLAMQSANGLQFNAQQLRPTSFETVTEPCPPATEKEVSAPATGAAEQEDVATIPDTSLPPNTAALDIFNGIVCDLNNGTLKVPMNGHKEYSPDTLLRNIGPIRRLLKNDFNDIPVPSSETDLVHILDNVATRTDIPKTEDAQLNKLPTAAKWFLKVLRSNMGDDFSVAPCDTAVSPPVEETIESDATPMSSLQEDAPDTPPVQEDATPLPDAPPQPATETKRPSRKNRKATMEVTRPQKKQKSSDTETAPNDNAFFDAMWERVLPKLMAKKKSVADYVNMAKRCTNGEETTFPPVQTVDELLNACLKFKGNTFDDITSRSQRNRIKKVIIAVTDYVERVGFDAARDYLFQNGAETAHPVSCA